MPKFVDYQILANTFVLKLKLCKILSAIFSIIIILFMVKKSYNFARHLGQQSHLNTTRGNDQIESVHENNMPS